MTATLGKNVPHLDGPLPDFDTAALLDGMLARLPDDFPRDNQEAGWMLGGYILDLRAMEAQRLRPPNVRLAPLPVDARALRRADASRYQQLRDLEDADAWDRELPGLEDDDAARAWQRHKAGKTTRRERAA